MARIGAWLEERASLSTVGRAIFLRNVPLGVGVLYTLGFAAAFVFALQIATGIVLMLYYAPTTRGAGRRALPHPGRRGDNHRAE